MPDHPAPAPPIVGARTEAEHPTPPTGGSAAFAPRMPESAGTLLQLGIDLEQLPLNHALIHNRGGWAVHLPAGDFVGDYPTAARALTAWKESRGRPGKPFDPVFPPPRHGPGRDAWAFQLAKAVGEECMGWRMHDGGRFSGRTWGHDVELGLVERLHRYGSLRQVRLLVRGAHLYVHGPTGSVEAWDPLKDEAQQAVVAAIMSAKGFAWAVGHDGQTHWAWFVPRRLLELNGNFALDSQVRIDAPLPGEALLRAAVLAARRAGDQVTSAGG